MSVHSGHDGGYSTCREPACVAHRARYVKRWQYERSQGLLRLTDATPVRLHIATLQGAGWSLRAIAGAAACSPGTVAKVAAGQQAKMARAVAARILAVDPAQVPSRASRQTREPFVPRVGTTRRLQALLFMGWGHKQMRKHCGLNTANLLHQQGQWVLRSTHDKVAAMYAALAMKPGPSPKARTYARRLGYVGPMDWDDIDLDGAPEKPDELCALHGCIATAQWVYDGVFTETRTLCSRHTKAGAA